MTVALNRNASRFTNGVLQCCDRLLLWSCRAGHVKDFFLHDRAVQIVDAVTQRDLSQWQAGAHPIGREVIDIIEINPANREIPQLFDRGRAFDVSQHSSLRFKRERNKAAKATRFILKLTKLPQMINALFKGLDMAVEHRAGAPTAHLMPGSMNI